MEPTGAQANGRGTLFAQIIPTRRPAWADSPLPSADLSDYSDNPPMMLAVNGFGPQFGSPM
jgi:hypothetical protein